MAANWNLKVGDALLRSALHDEYGAARRGGMEPSAQTPNVFLFTEPSAGARFGYKFDGWHEDGTFHYTGEGQIGDQVMKEGNRVVRDHVAERRALRLFRAAGPEVTYVGEFALPVEDPYLQDTAPDRDGDLRSVIIFRLAPLGHVLNVAGDPVAPKSGAVEEVPVEAANVDGYEQQHPEEPKKAVRREAALVGRYISWLAKKGHDTTRHRVPTPGGASMFTDIYDKSTNELIEAKSSSARLFVRAGLGQVLDYARFVDHDSKALLLPTPPSDDLFDLLNKYGVACIWEETTGHFARRDPI